MSFRKSRKRGPLFFILMVIGACLIVFLSYSVQEPLSLLLSGKLSSSSVPSSSKNNSASSDKTSSATTNSSSLTSSGSVRGISLSEKYLSDSAALDSLITSAKNINVNLAIIQLKGDDGYVAYNSKVAAAAGSSLMVDNPPDASVAAQKLSSNGITPAARISCFKDPLASVAIPSAAVLYSGNHTKRWLDSVDNRWLNPYSDAAQQYIIDLAKEAVSMGYKQIYLDNVEFPTGTSQAWFGDNISVTQEDALKAFVTKVTAVVQTAGGKVSIILPGNAVLLQANSQTGQNQNIYSFTADYYSPNLCPSLLNKTGVTIGSTTVSRPDLIPGDTLLALAVYLKSLSGAKLGATVPFIQAYTNTSLGDGYYKQYAPSDINAEIAALKSAGIMNFVLYSPTGSYNLSGINAQ